jgi:hypothetical protein
MVIQYTAFFQFENRDAMYNIDTIKLAYLKKAFPFVFLLRYS